MRAIAQVPPSFPPCAFSEFRLWGGCTPLAFQIIEILPSLECSLSVLPRPRSPFRPLIHSSCSFCHSFCSFHSFSFYFFIFIFSPSIFSHSVSYYSYLFIQLFIYLPLYLSHTLPHFPFFSLLLLAYPSRNKSPENGARPRPRSPRAPWARQTRL